MMLKCLKLDCLFVATMPYLDDALILFPVRVGVFRSRKSEISSLAANFQPAVICHRLDVNVAANFCQGVTHCPFWGQSKHPNV